MFDYYSPTRLHFGEGRLNEIATIINKYGNRCLLVTTPDKVLWPLYERVITLLEKGGIKVCHFSKVEPNPSSQMIEEGFDLLKKNPCDVILAVGGGSSIDTAKALAFTNGLDQIHWQDLFAFGSPYEDYPRFNDKVLPIIAVPTTAGTGSQVTQASVVNLGREKLTFYHPDLFPKECILDSELTLTLPNRITAATAFDAFTHAFESYISKRASFYSEQDSLAAMKLVIEYLPKVLKDPHNLDYRKHLTLADTLAGRALSNSGANAPHPLSELMGGLVKIPHGEALALVFKAFVKYSYPNYKEKMDTIAKLFNPSSVDLYQEIDGFLTTIGLNKKMRDYQIDEGLFKEMLASPMLDHLPFGNREFLENILKDSY